MLLVNTQLKCTVPVPTPQQRLQWWRVTSTRSLWLEYINHLRLRVEAVTCLEFSHSWPWHAKCEHWTNECWSLYVVAVVWAMFEQVEVNVHRIGLCVSGQSCSSIMSTSDWCFAGFRVFSCGFQPVLAGFTLFFPTTNLHYFRPKFFEDFGQIRPFLNHFEIQRVVSDRFDHEISPAKKIQNLLGNIQGIKIQERILKRLRIWSIQHWCAHTIFPHRVYLRISASDICQSLIQMPRALVTHRCFLRLTGRSVEPLRRHFTAHWGYFSLTWGIQISQSREETQGPAPRRETELAWTSILHLGRHPAVRRQQNESFTTLAKGKLTFR